jgi:hypothetical protein
MFIVLLIKGSECKFMGLEVCMCSSRLMVHGS